MGHGKRIGSMFSQLPERCTNRTHIDRYGIFTSPTTSKTDNSPAEGFINGIQK